MAKRHSTETSIAIGAIFGRWTVAGDMTRRGKDNRVYWLCRCECGTQAYVNAKNMLSGISRGCMKCRGISRENPEELLGKRYGNWQVLSFQGTNRHSVFQFQCRCHCGFLRIVQGTHLRTGRLPSCRGCMPKAQMERAARLIWKKLLWAAEERGFVVEVTWDELAGLLEQQDHKCALSGMSIRLAATIKEHAAGGTTASVDRIDSTKGYVSGNVQWVHKDVNRMKWELSQERFIELCKLIAEKHR